MGGRTGKRGILVVLAVCVSIPAFLTGHPDDPKAWDPVVLYVGPGYRADLDDDPLAAAVFDSLNVELLSWLTVKDFGDQMTWASDCWGYVSASGREYAILCLSDGTAFVEITNPRAAKIIGVIDGPHSTWRDVKIYKDYAYAVTEAGVGIQVIDLANIDAGTVTLVREITERGPKSTHNVAIDEESGFLYRCGGGGRGLRAYSLADPANPTFVGAWNDRYVHDAQIVTYTEGPYAGRQIAFVCSGFNSGWVEPGMDILDVTDKANITVIKNLTYPGAVYSHQGWLSPDRQYFYLGDELDEDGQINTTTHVIDVSDLENAQAVGTFTNDMKSVGHNIYTRGNLLYAANYTSGLRVFDTSDPANPVEVAWFDTYPENDNANFSGLWSNYPYFPSGVVLGSDRARGLFVLELTICTPPDIGQQPRNQGACIGDPVSFSVEAEGSGPLQYQWRKDGNDIPGANDARLAIADVTPQDAGVYDVSIVNECGAIDSEPVELTVDSPPTITSQPDDRTACLDDPVVLTVEAFGAEPLSYQWSKDGKDLPNERERVLRIAGAAPEDAGQYEVRVTNSCGLAAATSATLTIGSEPIITQEPQSRLLCEGDSLQITVQVQGAEPLTYQWRKDGRALAGFEGSTLEIAGVDAGDAGDYEVVVSNACGSASGAPAIVTVGLLPVIDQHPLAAATCEGRLRQLSVLTSDPDLTYQWRRDGQDIPGATSTLYATDVAGTYDCIVSNGCGSVASKSALLTVRRPFTWYRDADGDGYGDPAATTRDCDPPFGYVANSDDANDADAAVYPGAPAADTSGGAANETGGDDASSDADGPADVDDASSPTADADASDEAAQDQPSILSAAPCGAPLALIALAGLIGTRRGRRRM